MRISPANFLFVLSKIKEQQHAFLASALAAHGVKDIAPSYGDVLYVLDRSGPLPLQEIARRTLKDKSTVSTVVKRLEAGGYVTKEKSQDDSRCVSIGLTAKARRLRPLFWEISGEMNARLFQGLSEREQNALFRLIGKVFDNATAGAVPRERPQPRE